MRIFGDNLAFAIAYSPTEDKHSISCNFILKGNIIGCSPSYNIVGGCMFDLERLKKRIGENEGQLRNPLFENLSDEEIMELIYKSNQLEEDYNPAFAHLPSLPTNDLWYLHTVDLADTKDHYCIVVFEENNKLKFVWQQCTGFDNIVKPLNTVSVEHNVFYSVIDNFLSFMNEKIEDGFHWETTSNYRSRDNPFL